MVKLWGPMLSGLATGLQQYNQGQEDLAYTRQVRAQELQKGQLANQAAEMQQQAAQKQMQDAEDVNSFYKNALASQDNNQPSAPPASASPVAGTQGIGGGVATSQSLDPGEQVVAQNNFKPVGPMSIDQLASLDQKYQLPVGTAYGLMHAETNGKADAVSPKGAVGLFQVMPATAAQPGYGLKAFDPKDPDAAMGYFAKMYQKAGGDMNKALAYWNAGPKGNPNNPETKAFIPRVAQGAHQFAQSYQLDQSKQQPTPAEQIGAREAAGANTPVTAYQQASQSQARQIQTLTRAAQDADKQGRHDLAVQFSAQAEKLQDQQMGLQKKTLDVQKEANEETSKLAVGVKDQSSYDNFKSQIGQNPAMQSAVAGLHLTGDYNQDRNKIQTLADRTLTLKDQQDMQLKQQEFQLKKQKEDRAQQKEDQVKVQYEQVQVADANRRSEVQSKGLPFAPSIASTLPPGTPPAVAQKAQKAVQDAQIKYQQNNMNALGATKQTQTLASTLIGLLDSKNNPVQTGGIFQNLVPGYGKAITSIDPARQEFDKVSNQLVTAATQALGAAGGGRSSFTAAMYDRVKTQKPNLDLKPETNRKIAGEYYNIAAMGQNKAQFMNEYMTANPGALPQTGELQWASYEQSLGPSVIVDPDAEGGYILNTAGVPTLPDGRPNTELQKLP